MAGVSTTVVHATCDQILARLSSPEAGVVVSSVDVQEVDRLARRVEAVRLALVAAADRQQVHRRCGHSSTSAWVASATRSGGAAAARDVAVGFPPNRGGLALRGSRGEGRGLVVDG